MKRVLNIAYKSGLYQIKNTATGQVYLGSSVNICRRLTSHITLLRKKSHPNKKLQASFTQYGESSFTFSELLRVPPEDLTKEEQRICDETNPYFNIRSNVNNNRGVKLSDETKAKMSEAHKGKRCHINSLKALIISNKGRAGNITENMKDALALGPLSLKGKSQSAETRRLISLSKVGRKFNKETRKYEPLCN